jgi:hypothetical protein
LPLPICLFAFAQQRNLVTAGFCGVTHPFAYTLRGDQQEGETDAD